MKTERSMPQKLMTGTSAASLAALLCFAALYRVCGGPVFLTLAITAGTVCYHFSMRLAVGWFVLRFFRKRLDAESRWFREKGFEKRLYRFLRVKQWKGKAPTYDPGTFSVQSNSPEEIVKTMCASELVHEINALLSFVPLAFSAVFGEAAVFTATSVAAALFDLSFVLPQRYNRPRAMRIIKRRESRG